MDAVCSRSVNAIYVRCIYTSIIFRTPNSLSILPSFSARFTTLAAQIREIVNFEYFTSMLSKIACSAGVKNPEKFIKMLLPGFGMPIAMADTVLTEQIEQVLRIGLPSLTRLYRSISTPKHFTHLVG